MSEASTTKVKYGVLIKSGSDYFEIGSIEIKRQEGDIFYVPSQRGTVNSNRGIIQGILEHFSWHKSGRVHCKIQGGVRDILEVGKGEVNPPAINAPVRQVIQDIGFQEIIRDSILDFSKLPRFRRKIDDLDIVFDIGSYSGPVEFVFSIISGRLIVARYQGEKVPLKEFSDTEKKRILASQERCLGCESGNADKLLQYMLFEYTGVKELTTGRRVFVAGDSKIGRQI